MDTKFTRVYIEQLGHKLKSGTITPEELADFEAWYTLQAEKELILPQDFADSAHVLKNRMYEKVWQKLAEPSAPSIPLRFLLWRKIAVAASLLLVLGVGGYFIAHNSIKGDALSSRQTILPGRNQAMLTLANGSKISLTTAAKGQIAIQSGIRINKTADGQLVYETTGTTEGSAIEYNTVEAPVGGQWQLILPDRSKVWLNAMSSITYPTRFIGKERRVKISGEAYFEVSHHKTMPFMVQSKAQTVEVLGTHFNVTAYADDQLTRTTLLEGSVKVLKEGKSALLIPGQQAQVGSNGIQVTNKVDTEDVVAWKNGYFKFNENLESIMNKVARWYNVEIVYAYKPDPNLTFSGALPRNKDLSALLKVIEFNGDVHFRIEGRKVIVMK